MDCVRDKTLQTYVPPSPWGEEIGRYGERVDQVFEVEEYYNVVWLEERELKNLVIQDQWGEKKPTHLT